MTKYQYSEERYNTPLLKEKNVCAFHTLLDLTRFFYSKILATLLPVIYCRNALKLKLNKKYNLLVLVHFLQ